VCLCATATGFWNALASNHKMPWQDRSAVKTGAPAVVAPLDSLAAAFKRFDTDGNGFLDAAELKAAFEAAGQPASDETIKHSFSLLDSNGDGKVSLDEFRAMADQNLMPSLAQFSMQDLGHVFEANTDTSSRLRDEKLAKAKPGAWCADRCLAVGECDVLEDIYEMTTAQVQKFCEACAGSDECELAYA
jgi:hypothetical protein